MKTTLAALALCASLPALAQQAKGEWTLELNGQVPSFNLTADGKDSDGDAISVNAADALGVKRDGAGLGLGLEYQGPRFGFRFAFDRQSFSGNKVLDVDQILQGDTFKVGATVATRMPLTTWEGLWTTRILTRPTSWLAVDLGVRTLKMDLSMSSTLTAPGVTQTQKDAWSINLPLPQLGLSGGFSVLEDRLRVRGHVHYLSVKQIKIANLGVDAKYFITPAFGAQVSYSNETVSGRTDDETIKMTRGAVGLGVFARF